MTEQTRFGDAGREQKPALVNCASCEAQLMDALDGVLSETEQAAFEAHLQHCAACAKLVGDARRGAAWLEMLREVPPEPPAALLERILAETCGAAMPATAAGMPMATGQVLPFRRRAQRWSMQGAMHALMQPRLAMTAAMAFFSIALTLNLTGIHPTQLRASDLSPTSLRRTFYQTNAKVVRSFNNLRVVYELESRVRELQRTSSDDGDGRDKNDDKGTGEDKSKRPAGQERPQGKSSRGGKRNEWRAERSGTQLLAVMETGLATRIDGVPVQKEERG